MKHDNSQFGLVLTGGGALGAYEVGALRYLVEIGFNPSIIAGTSIGALNSAVLATYKPLSHAVERLDELWLTLGEVHLLKVNVLTASKFITQFFVPSLSIAYDLILDFSSSWGIVPNSTSILDITPIEQHIRQLIHPAELRNGKELWVTAFPCLSFFGIELDTTFEIVRAYTGGGETHWLHVNSFEKDEDIWSLLLASSALPWIFPRRRVAGTTYMDGGLTDNVPLKPLADRGCNYVVVIHLENGSPWNRQDFPDQTVIEIRPRQPIQKSNRPIFGMASSLLDFTPTRIQTLKQRGYEDAKFYMEPILSTLKAVSDERKSVDSLVDSTMSTTSLTQELWNDEPLDAR